MKSYFCRVLEANTFSGDQIALGHLNADLCCSTHKYARLRYRVLNKTSAHVLRNRDLKFVSENIAHTNCQYSRSIRHSLAPWRLSCHVSGLCYSVKWREIANPSPTWTTVRAKTPSTKFDKRSKTTTSQRRVPNGDNDNGWFGNSTPTLGLGS